MKKGAPANLRQELRASPEWFRTDFLWNFKRYLNEPLNVRFGDNTVDFDRPTLCKSRPIGAVNCALLPFNFKRHWRYGAPAVIAAADCAWSEKTPTLVWRGATTGKRPFEDEPRCHLVQRWFGRQDIGIDVGYYKVVQGHHECEPMVLPLMPIDHQLRHAFVASPEGNDVASNLKWILASNSVPVMPAPRYETWLLESQLKPMVHYLPVLPDFSDLEEQLAWARSHMAECEAIGQAGKEYIRPFYETIMEQRLMDAVVRRFKGA